MPTATTRPMASTLHLALDLGNTTWHLAFASGFAHAPRLRTVPARDLTALATELATARRRVGLPADAPVVTCYEAGRDGFWVHRALAVLGVRNTVVDAPCSRADTRHCAHASAGASCPPLHRVLRARRPSGDAREHRSFRRGRAPRSW